jgi:hypothetical protein
MPRAYLQARLTGYSTLEAVRVAVLVARLSLRDPPTDTWGRRAETCGRRAVSNSSAIGGKRKGARHQGRD